ncbi:hypothetical protein OV079_23165 [Nannocystis pusilla]|uniref:Uncharacterized protein n=1 Tax=Nannocystis pusilla TaxID=889268 RepID=A0A9X3EZ85_9BACT|nr:hypothetical protein [Nannocystis pusilla]MCY1008403.1 hypothetical protein [Nannocystis pusilla]
MTSLGPMPLGCANESEATVGELAAAPPRERPWWCLCYQRNDLQRMTACRETPGACEELRQLVERGTAEILAGSASTGCEAVQPSHPGEVLGSRDQWRPSQKAGSWISQGACLLRATNPH